MDSEKRDRLSELVEELTTSGEPSLNADKMKEVKKICKSSTQYIEQLYHLIMTQLNQEHAEIRLSAFHMVAELFSRSHDFRLLIVANMQEFLELTVETDSDNPLPPPKEVAQKMKRLAIQTVQSWHETYGEAYKKLALAYHFLKQVKKVDFQDVEVRTLTERRRQEERQRRLQTIYKEKLDKAKAEMEETCEDIEESLTEMQNCVEILLPDPDNFAMCNLEPTAGPSSSGEPAPSRDSPTPTSKRRDEDDPEPCCSRDLDKDTGKKRGNEKEKEKRKGKEKEKRKGKEKEVEVERTATDDTDDADDTDEKKTPEGDEEDRTSFLRNSGVISHKYSLELDISTDVNVQESEDNEAVLSNIRDLQRIISTKHLPAVKSWIQVFTKVGGEEQHLRRAMDLKQSLEAALQKYSTLHISHDTRQRRVMRADESDDDFEEVPEREDFEPRILDDLRVEYGLEPLISTSSPSSSSSSAAARGAPKPIPAPAPALGTGTRVKRKASDEELDPTTAAATLRILRQRLPASASTSTSLQCEASTSSATSSKATESGEGQKAPFLPFGIDLYYWGKEQPTAGKIVKNSLQHQFWVPNAMEEEVVNEELSAQMKARYITFAGRFQPVQHRCKAPMPNGSLCERQDRVKCPFHGKIIPRDELGNPMNKEDAERLEKEKRKQQEEQPDWRDPELMREIEAATGEDLGSDKTFGKGKKGAKGKGKKKKKYPGLTDLKQNANTSRSRLEKKVFNKSSMRRVTAVMNKMDSRKHEKFSNQFNYALN
ncbi:UV-stimulated scaffold protein A [Engraulis encrasicolus]|uniref:UV-stimulated scaffold protein A n=1 Tax=Engraulis encrasicolus TaxID=184585 RepID=UPI002FD6FF2F